MLSARSHMCSSVSPSLPLIPSSMFFISVILFFGSDWFFFIFSSSVFKFSLYLSILFPNSVHIFINALTFLYGTFFKFVSVFIFQFFFSLALLDETNYFFFSFGLTLSVSIKLGETITYCSKDVLKWSFPI